MNLKLVKNPDIIAEVAATKNGPLTVGFAAETEKLIEHARTKLHAKGLDMIVANDVSTAEAGFNSDYNAVTVLWADGHQDIALANKNHLAAELIPLIAARARARADHAA